MTPSSKRTRRVMTHDQVAKLIGVWHASKSREKCYAALPELDRSTIDAKLRQFGALPTRKRYVLTSDDIADVDADLVRIARRGRPIIPDDQRVARIRYAVNALRAHLSALTLGEDQHVQSDPIDRSEPDNSDTIS